MFDFFTICVLYNEQEMRLHTPLEYVLIGSHYM